MNRVVSINSTGLTYEADPRHTDLLMSSLNLSEANAAGTPGVKPSERDDLAVKTDEPDNSKLDSCTDQTAMIAAILAEDPDEDRQPKGSLSLEAKSECSAVCASGATDASVGSMSHSSDGASTGLLSSSSDGVSTGLLSSSPDDVST